VSQTTKLALALALKNHLEKTPLDKITVKDLVEDCKVNRQTFYYHFQDIYALLEWMFLLESKKAISENKTYSTWQQGFLQAFYYVKENKSIAINIFHSIGRELLESYLYSIVYNLLMGVINEQAEGMLVVEENKQFIANFYKCAFVGLMLEWIRTGMKEKPEDIIDKLDKLICGDIQKALLKYEK
jgi:probable dihydroxyacetone kinase regulator